MSIVTQVLLSVYQLQYQIAPILFVNGIANGIGTGANSNQSLPITHFTENLPVPLGITQNGVNLSLEDFFCQFKPATGSTLQNWQIANYPFANSTIAANATIAQPLTVSLIMVCPARGLNTLPLRQGILTRLKQALDVHILQGGTFTVLTPAYVYTNCLLVALRDITSQDDKQVQSVYQWDFVQPLLTQQSAAQAYNGLMNALQNNNVLSGTATNSGPLTTIPLTGNSGTGALQ
jgi:hypothetical protein